ncbi:ribonuclease P protein component 4 [Candidatus Lokiarchaeum ossiferum]|uniref:ribonuclease P protein component 4 n=1 Tax=Candidatus Lokiarchaeum ossiferum TaxID=2951803 RepID=UPI00352F4A91
MTGHPRNSSPFRFRHQKRRRKKQMKQHILMQDVATERVNDLLDRAHAIYSTNSVLANRYVFIARRIAMGAKINIPLSKKRYICHSCKKLLSPGNNMHFRMNHKKHYGSYLSVTCHMCGHITRYIVKGKVIDNRPSPAKPSRK